MAPSLRNALVAAFCVTVSAVSEADEALESSRSLWNSAGITSYEYSYRKVCECHRDMPSDTIVTVAGGDIVDVRYDREDYASQIPVASDQYRWFRTIDDLFALVETALQSAATLRVAYDDRLGYPTYVFIDYDHGLVGEEVELEVFSLRAAE